MTTPESEKKKKDDEEERDATESSAPEPDKPESPLADEAPPANASPDEQLASAVDQPPEIEHTASSSDEQQPPPGEPPGEQPPVEEPQRELSYGVLHITGKEGAVEVPWQGPKLVLAPSGFGKTWLARRQLWMDGDELVRDRTGWPVHTQLWKYPEKDRATVRWYDDPAAQMIGEVMMWSIARWAVIHEGLIVAINTAPSHPDVLRALPPPDGALVIMPPAEWLAARQKHRGARKGDRNMQPGGDRAVILRNLRGLENIAKHSRGSITITGDDAVTAYNQLHEMAVAISEHSLLAPNKQTIKSY